MNYFKELMLLINSTDKRNYDLTLTCANATSKIITAFALVEEDSFNTCFNKAINEYSSDLKTIDADLIGDFILVLQQKIKQEGLAFQVKDREELDYEISDNGEIVELKTTLYSIMQEMVVNSLDAPDYCEGIEYFERLLRNIKRKAIKDAVAI